MTHKILFYVDVKLGRQWIKFTPLYGEGEEFEREKQIIHAFKDAVDNEFKKGYIDKDCVFWFDTKTSEALQFIWKNFEPWMYTVDYTSYQRVLDKKKAKEKDNNLSLQKEFSQKHSEITE